MLKKILLNKKILLLIDIILLIISIFAYKKIYNEQLLKKRFENYAVKFAEEQEKPIFNVEKIILYNSAFAVDNSQEKIMENVDISQFTDIALYINNKNKSEEITPENTISEMYIDNIKININEKKGEKILNYKNPNSFGKFLLLDNYENNTINFNIIKTNQEKNSEEVLTNSFYTDCSDPITLGFINKNIIKGAKAGIESGIFTFNGSILKSANLDLEQLSGRINFNINLKNNYGEEFLCNCNIPIDLTQNEKEIYSGYSIKMENLEGINWEFIKKVK